MDIYKTNLFKYVKGDMVKDRPVVMTIETVKMAKMANIKTGEVEEKYLLTFKESPKPLILNATNAGNLAKMFGRDTDKWAGQVVEIYAEEVKAFGKLHNAARIREAKQVKQAQKSKQQAEQSTLQERQMRIKQNGNPLHGDDDNTPIGEDSDADRFADEVMKHVPFYTSRSQVFMALATLQMEFSEETKELCIDALAREAQRQADAAAA